MTEVRLPRRRPPEVAGLLEPARGPLGAPGGWRPRRAGCVTGWRRAGAARRPRERAAAAGPGEAGRAPPRGLFSGRRAAEPAPPPGRPAVGA